jgi:DNA segregation ATPase FtsK/SpoIIIE, S-DNA-T family
MANRRKSAPRHRDEITNPSLARTRLARHRTNPRREPVASTKGAVHHEAIAVALWCVGILTILSLASYRADDVSLNASGSARVANWIGPFGAYWADMLLQTLGIGSYALAVGLMLAGWRAFVGRRILPTFRELAGTIMSMTSVGALAHLFTVGMDRPYPAGGIAGAVLGNVLLDHFAVVGAYVLTSALILVSFAITADGVLVGLGLRGLGALKEVAAHLWTAWIVMRERQKRFAELRRKQLEVEDVPESDHWTMGAGTASEESPPETVAEAPQPPPLAPAAARQKRLKEAKEKGQKLGEAAAERQLREAKKRAVREISEPSVRIDSTVDLPAEEKFEMGELPAVAPATPAPVSASDDLEVEVEPADLEVEVAIRAAEPEKPGMVPPPSEVDITQPDLPAQQPAAPKRLLSGRKKKEEPQIVDVRPEVDVAKIESVAAETTSDPQREFELPAPSLLDYQAAVRAPIDSTKLKDNAVKLTKTLKSYGIDGHVREIRPGPVITMYEYVPAPGVKISKIASLADDIAMSMEALRVRIVAPIPGKGAVGIEIPNDSTETVYLKELITADIYRTTKSKLTMALGKDIEGNGYVADLTRMPHLLVAGATGAGKSVSVNSMIMSILFKATPSEVRFIMVDPKMLELSVYDGIPHLLLPVVTDPKKASLALRWAVEEMERRYKKLSALAVRNIDGYNRRVRQAVEKGEKLEVTTLDKLGNEVQEKCEHLPYIVVIVDELADLMMVASREVESSIMRLAQMARAAGIHLILATQRPSVDVITGVIKANFPTRIAFQVASKHDSRTILDANGAEHLLGKGDMLFMSPGAGGITRVHGAFVSDEEIQRSVAFLKEQGRPQYDESILAPREDAAGAEVEEGEKDEMYDQAVAIVIETRQASISMIQRRLRIGYNRAARLVEMMETEGLVGPADGAKPREVLAPPAQP